MTKRGPDGKFVAKEETEIFKADTDSTFNIVDDRPKALFRHTRVPWERDNKDLELFRALINFFNVVAERGAIKGDELLASGVLFHNLQDRIQEMEQFMADGNRYNEEPI